MRRRGLRRRTSSSVGEALPFCSLNRKRLTLRGFINYDFADELYEEFQREIARGIAEGRIRYREDIVDGLENAPKALINMLDGRNFGKRLRDSPF